MRTAMKMVHATDPKLEIVTSAGDLTGIEIPGNNILIGFYKRPEKTASNVYLPDSVRKEDEYQGKAGLVLKMGSQAFVDSADYSFDGFTVGVGDWVASWVSDGRQIQIGNCLCKVVKDTEIRMKLSSPDQVY